MSDSIQTPAIEFMKGIEDLIPRQALRLLSESELGLMLSGMPKLDGT